MIQNKKTQLVAVNLECDKKNQFFDIREWTDEEVKQKIKEYDLKKWIMLTR